MKTKAILTLGLLLAIGQEAWAEGEIELTSTTSQLGGNTYVVSQNITVSSRITVAENQHATLIIKPGCTLTCEAGINVGEDETLSIQGTGTLRAYGDTQGGAAIGGNQNATSGTINIREATIFAYGGADGAGIGGGSGAQAGTINIYSGNIEAYGNKDNTDYTTSNGAGIGGGVGNYGGTISITGGTVKACGGQGAAGIDNTTTTLGEAMAVYTGETFSTRAGKAERVTKLGENKVMVKPCDHSGATSFNYQDKDTHTLTCAYCAATSTAHTFDSEGAAKCTGCHLLRLMDRGDNASVLSTYNGQYMKTVIISGRTFYKDNCWNTLCLPFSISSDELPNILGSPRIMTLSSSSFADGTLTLTFTQVSEIEAGKPYLIKWPSGSGPNRVDPLFGGVTINNAVNDTHTDKVDFKGNLSAFPLTGGDKTKLYLAADNKLYTPKTDKTLGAFRAYFSLNGLTAGTPSAGARTIVLDFGDETTVINVMQRQEDHKECYDMSGRRLELPAKGIYIMNGRKVVVK